ncbi:MAG: ZIP family metal transporter [Bacilli bacterium]|nr:ZIP family metal transporter [Bacilli bacterium]
MNLVALFLTLIVGLFIFLGCICGLNYKDNKKFTDFSIAMAFGVIISLIIFEIIPETYEVLNNQIGIVRSILVMIILSLIGIMILKILDLFVPHHEHEAHHEHSHKSEKCHNEHLYHIGIISSVAVIIHNLIEGMSLYLVSSHSIMSGLLMCIGIGLHNIPMGLVISSTLSTSKFSKKKILNISLIVSLSTFVGGVIMFILGGVNELLEGILLGLTLGMLIYISIFELFHQIYHMKNKRIAKIGIIVGVVLLVISVLLGHSVHMH